MGSLRYTNAADHFSGKRTVTLYGENSDNRVFAQSCEVSLNPLLPATSGRPCLNTKGTQHWDRLPDVLGVMMSGGPGIWPGTMPEIAPSDPPPPPPPIYIDSTKSYTGLQAISMEWQSGVRNKGFGTLFDWEARYQNHWPAVPCGWSQNIQDPRTHTGTPLQVPDGSITFDSVTSEWVIVLHSIVTLYPTYLRDIDLTFRLKDRKMNPYGHSSLDETFDWELHYNDGSSDVGTATFSLVAYHEQSVSQLLGG
ncbi:MAG: hypothetical protein Fues2KO_47390 [Fuerstiella sp.]